MDAMIYRLIEEKHPTSNPLTEEQKRAILAASETMTVDMIAKTLKIPEREVRLYLGLTPRFPGELLDIG